MLGVTIFAGFRTELETSASFGNKMAEKDPSSSVATQSKWAVLKLSVHEITPGQRYIVDKCLFEEVILGLGV